MDGQGWKGQRKETEQRKEGVSGGEFIALGPVAFDEGEELVEQDRQQAHVEERGPEPAAARQAAKGQKRQGSKGCRREGGHGDRGLGATHDG